LPLRALEDAISAGKLNIGVTSPRGKIDELWKLAKTAGDMEYTCTYVIDVIERLCKTLSEQCPKYDVLLERLILGVRKRIAIIVPKAYYIDILTSDERVLQSGATIITANRFDADSVYDEIIAVGDIVGKRFDPSNCRAAMDITVLLYGCETRTFSHKGHNAKRFEKKLNTRWYVDGEKSIDEHDDTNEAPSKDDNIDEYAENEMDLEQYIDKISIFDIRKLAARISTSAGNTPTSEVCAIGRFVSGEQILFSKYYRAVIFDSALGAVTETDSEKLVEGDVLIFAKRNDYTRNMVDYIYESLQSGNRLSQEVLDATEKALYWKEVLREYKNTNGLSYKAIATGLRKLGSSIQEVSVRQWLVEESHIVGPRDEITLERIAELTSDPYMLADTNSYFEACRMVRRQRKEILVLLGKAITDKLRGHMPQSSLLETVYENMEKLSEVLELESIAMLDEPITAPVSIINKPLSDTEVAI